MRMLVTSWVDCGVDSIVLFHRRCLEILWNFIFWSEKVCIRLLPYEIILSFHNAEMWNDNFILTLTNAIDFFRIRLLPCSELKGTWSRIECVLGRRLWQLELYIFLNHNLLRCPVMLWKDSTHTIKWCLDLVNLPRCTPKALREETIASLYFFMTWSL